MARTRSVETRIKMRVALPLTCCLASFAGGVLAGHRLSEPGMYFVKSQMLEESQLIPLVPEGLEAVIIREGSLYMVPSDKRFVGTGIGLRRGVEVAMVQWIEVRTDGGEWERRFSAQPSSTVLFASTRQFAIARGSRIERRAGAGGGPGPAVWGGYLDPVADGILPGPR